MIIILIKNWEIFYLNMGRVFCLWVTIGHFHDVLFTTEKEVWWEVSKINMNNSLCRDLDQITDSDLCVNSNSHLVKPVRAVKVHSFKKKKNSVKERNVQVPLEYYII